MTADGHVVYRLSRTLRAALASSSLLLWLEPALAAGGRALAYVGRLSFSVALFASLAIVGSAVFMVIFSSGSSSSSSDSDNRRSRSSGMRAGLDLTNLSLDIGRSLDYFAWRRQYEQPAGVYRPNAELGFLESIFR